MAIPSRRALEANELGWWSNWATPTRFGRDAYVLTSRQFQEPFFNRACFVTCGAVSAHAEAAERRLHRVGQATTLTVGRSCASATKALLRAGYRVSETMSVMTSTEKPGPTDLPDAEIRMTSSATAGDWARAYLLSFYGDLAMMRPVVRIARRLVRNRSATLLEARQEGEVAGGLAVFRTPGLAGIYCVGTVPKFRRRGIAGALLGRASQIASAEARVVTLQTLESDGAENFYAKRGFVTRYRKDFMAKESYNQESG